MDLLLAGPLFLFSTILGMCGLMEETRIPFASYKYSKMLQKL